MDGAETTQSNNDGRTCDARAACIAKFDFFVPRTTYKSHAFCVHPAMPQRHEQRWLGRPLDRQIIDGGRLFDTRTLRSQWLARKTHTISISHRAATSLTKGRKKPADMHRRLHILLVQHGARPAACDPCAISKRRPGEQKQNAARQLGTCAVRCVVAMAGNNSKRNTKPCPEL